MYIIYVYVYTYILGHIYIYIPSGKLAWLENKSLLMMYVPLKNRDFPDSFSHLGVRFVLPPPVPWLSCLNVTNLDLGMLSGY